MSTAWQTTAIVGVLIIGMFIAVLPLIASLHAGGRLQVALAGLWFLLAAMATTWASVALTEHWGWTG